MDEGRGVMEMPTAPAESNAAATEGRRPSLGRALPWWGTAGLLALNAFAGIAAILIANALAIAVWTSWAGGLSSSADAAPYRWVLRGIIVGLLDVNFVLLVRSAWRKAMKDAD